MKESAPDEIIKTALPLLQRNNVVHFLGFVNRLAFDPMEPNLQVNIVLQRFCST